MLYKTLRQIEVNSLVDVSRDLNKKTENQPKAPIKLVMKIKISLLAGFAALGFASSAPAQTIINITGATAFRAAANNTILELLNDGSPGTAKYAWVGDPGQAGFAGSNRIIVEGTIAGNPFIIRTSQSGSTAGIRDVVLAQAPENDYLSVSATSADRTTAGNNIDAAGKTESGVIPRFTFSDVDQAISNNPTPSLPGGGVGVVPFVFIANVGAPAGLSNITDQLHDAQWSTGQLPLSMYTGDSSDTKLVLNMGRNSSSGTRATILSETQYGPFRTVKQWGGPNNDTTVSGPEGSGTVDALDDRGNDGYNSNSHVRRNLARTSTNVTVDGNGGQDVVIVSYLTLSDAAAITTLTGGPGVGARALTYNGVPYSFENVTNGHYTLWGYQQFYRATDATSGEEDFYNAFAAAIPAQLDPLSTGIPTSEMNVTRSGGDGGPITPN